MPSLTERLAGYLAGAGHAYRAVYRTGDKGQCVHLTTNATRDRAPTLCGIDRTDNGGGVLRYKRSKFFEKGAWMRLPVSHFEGRNYLGSLLGWMPSDRHLCRKCLHSLPKTGQK